MGQRLDLHEILCATLGSRNVYYQPPEGFKLSYPCIVYEREKIESNHANNKPYLHRNRYSVTVIDRDPESPIPNKIAAYPTSRFVDSFVSDNLHHDVFTVYY